jgi:hypothetical protein
MGGQAVNVLELNLALDESLGRVKQGTNTEAL